MGPIEDVGGHRGRGHDHGDGVERDPVGEAPEAVRPTVRRLRSPIVEIESRRAQRDDIPVLVEMYRGLEAEQGSLRPLWPIADGLDEPIADSLRSAIEDAETLLLIGTIDDAPVGFLMARPEPLLVQAQGEEVGTIRLIHTDEAARGVGVGEAMMAEAMAWLRERGLRRFDAMVSPGHRSAKNFFESHGFSARLIVMHHTDAPDD